MFRLKITTNYFKNNLWLYEISLFCMLYTDSVHNNLIYWAVGTKLYRLYFKILSRLFNAN